MTQDPRIDRLEGVLERIIADQAEYRQDMREMRAEFHRENQQMRTEFQAETQQMRTESRQETQEIRVEIRSRFNTLLIVNIALWVATIGTFVGFFLTGV
jgi:hypothetical protein